MNDKEKHLPDKYFGFLQHYYRAEVYRETNWRNRLDVTTNWSIVVTAAMMSYTFSNPQTSHTIIFINFLIVWFFLYAESRRFRYYTMLKRRTRLLEEKVLGPLFSKGTLPQLALWGETLDQELKNAQVTMSRLESVAWRLRRNYMFIFPLMFLAWVGKLSLIAQLKNIDALEAAQILFIPGEVVFVVFLLAVVATLAIAIYLPNTSEEDDLP